jgi:signal transduction histidine kinase
MGMGRSLYGLADADGTVIIPVGNYKNVGQQLTNRQISAGTRIEVGGKQVGVLLTTNALPVYNVAETLFLQRTTRALIFAMFGAMLVALLIGLVLARTLTLPLRALTQAVQKVTRGQLEQQVEVKSEDEIGELGLAFNQMSREVARVNQQRRQMTADIAHDLRTPLTVISGYVESMRDGVLQPTQQRLELIYGEIGRLQHLVTDLRMLSQADAGELRLEPLPVDSQTILEHTAEIHQHQTAQQNVALRVQVESGLPAIRLDEARFMQMMDNLISNALRYTPPGGSITLGARRQSSGIEFRVSDTGSGIEPDELPWIFDRFQRGDKSRHSDGNESGLGLAIVKALAEAHGGKVTAESVVGNGTTIRVWLPI